MENGLNTEGKQIREIAPEITRTIDQRPVDDFIDEVLKHRALDSERAAAIQDTAPEHHQALARIESTFPHVDEFLVFMEEQFPKTPPEKLPEGIDGERSGDRARIRNALALMLKLHVHQRDRIDSGQPFISHPLAVATRVLETYDGPGRSQVVAAALLHDSIEDQARLLALEKELAARADFPHVSPEEIEREGALYGIGHLFGLHTQVLVRALTNPRLLGERALQGEHHKAYEAYISDIFFSETLPSAVAVIKWADLQENALTIGAIADNAEAATTAPEQERYWRVYAKLRDKYRPALLIVRDFFTEVAEAHPLYAERERAIADIDTALTEHYTRA